MGIAGVGCKGFRAKRSFDDFLDLNLDCTAAFIPAQTSFEKYQGQAKQEKGTTGQEEQISPGKGPDKLGRNSTDESSRDDGEKQQLGGPIE